MVGGRNVVGSRSAVTKHTKLALPEGTFKPSSRARLLGIPASLEEPTIASIKCFGVSPPSLKEGKPRPISTNRPKTLEG